MKKSHALRSRVICGLVGLILTLGLVAVGTLVSLAGSVNTTVGFSWVSSWTAYADLFTKSLFATELWLFSNPSFMYEAITWWVLVVLVVLFFVILFVTSLAKKKARYLGLAFYELFLGLVIGVTYLAFVTAAIEKVDFYGIFKTTLLFGDGEWWISLLLWVLLVSILLLVASWLVLFFLGLAKVCAKEKAAEKVEEAPKPVEVTPVEPVAPVAPEKKKGILIVKRYDKLGETGPVVEKPNFDYPKQVIEQKPLTLDEIRLAVREEIERHETQKILQEYHDQKQAETIAKAIVKAQGLDKPVKEETVTPLTTTIEGKAEKEEEKVYPSPIVFAMPTSIREETVKVEKPKVEPKPKKEGLSEDRVREIIASEIKEALKDLVITHETIIEKPVEVRLKSEEAPEEVKTEEKAQETKVEPEVADETAKEETHETVVETNPYVETKEEEKPVEEEKVEVTPETLVESDSTETKEEVPTEEVKDEEKAEPVAEEAPKGEDTVAEKEAVKEEETPVVEAPQEEEKVELTETVEKPKIIRIPFTTRMLAATDDLKSAYNEIKSLLKSYGLNNRVANGGDSFRLHRVTYCKITVAGKSLKLYLALDPKDYADTTYPIKDAGSKALYKETPLVFKVKSGLSLRRAEELIRDCMDKHGLEQIDQIQLKDWASELKNVKVEDDGQDLEDEE